MSSPSPVFTNPILPGFHPDPTACRVGDWYYLAVSSFMYFPAIPLYRSRDLVHWEAVGHALTRLSQFPPSEQAHSDGIFAPTLRHDGKQFYLITTNVRGCGNFVVTAPTIEGPWSDPLVLDAPGIDPSLFFDEGRVWITGTADVPEGPRYFGNNEIWLREWDPANGGWKGPRIGLWRGAVRDSVWPEGPHLYRRNGWYYLLISEGGTAIDHSITVARSRSVEGPYVGNPKNPILTHRHLGQDYPVANVGHPDLVEAGDGSWWMVLLASRPHSQGGTNRGRETFLVPVVWEQDWPVASVGTGKVEAQYVAPLRQERTWHDCERTGAFDGFEAATLASAWQFLRSAAVTLHSLEARPGWLRLYGQAEGPGTRRAQAWVGRRVLHQNWLMRCRFEAPETEGARAGLCVVQNDDNHLRLERTLEGGRARIDLVSRRGGTDHRVATWNADAPFLELSAQGHGYRARFSDDGAHWTALATNIDGTHLTTEAAGGFVGCLVGPFAVLGPADFDWVDYRGHD